MNKIMIFLNKAEKGIQRTAFLEEEWGKKQQGIFAENIIKWLKKKFVVVIIYKRCVSSPF